ncbi:hypothetical protein [Streptomyces sp. R08]|uniref:EF-hand domain-containing protein n=1 Tax=Streptomyces sp. R08 TaxID=3238624 RepID=A0AB39LZK1_9ACTN
MDHIMGMTLIEIEMFAKWVYSADADLDGQITKDEFTAYNNENASKSFEPGFLEGVFDAFDLDGSGTVDVEEMAKVWKDEAARLKAAAGTVAGLAKPYPTESIRIVSSRGGSLFYANGIVTAVKHQGGDNYVITQTNVNGPNQRSEVYGTDAIVGDTRTQGGPSESEKRVDRFLNGEQAYSW